MGSKIETKKLMQAIQLTATEALAYLMEPYHNSQCIVKRIPMPLTIKISLRFNCFNCKISLGIKLMAMLTIQTRNHTNGNSCMEITRPKIAVIPHRNVAICMFK